MGNILGQKFHGDEATVSLALCTTPMLPPPSGIDGAEVVVHGDAQDQLGQIMKDWTLVVYSSVGQTFLYAGKGGDAFAFPTSAAQHREFVTLHGPMDPLQCLKVPRNAVVRIVTAKHLIEVVCLLPDRRVQHPPHRILQVQYGASQSRLFRTQADMEVASGCACSTA